MSFSDQLLAYWKFNESSFSGTDAIVDSGPNGYHGTIAGNAAPEAAVFGNGAALRSGTGRIKPKTISTIFGTGAGSISFRLKVTSILGGNLEACILGAAGAPFTNRWALGVQVNGAGYSLYTRAIGGAYRIASGTVLTYGTTYHVVVTRSASAPHTWKFYVNKVLVYTESGTDNASCGDDNVFIGSDESSIQYTGNNYLIDDMALWTRELPATGSESVETIYDAAGDIASLITPPGPVTANLSTEVEVQKVIAMSVSQLLAVPTVSGNALFNSADKLREVEFVYKHSGGTFKKVTFRNNGSNVFPNQKMSFGISGTWTLMGIYLFDYSTATMLKLFGGTLPSGNNIVVS